MRSAAFLLATLLLPAVVGGQEWRGPAALDVMVEDAKGRNIAGAEVLLVYLSPDGGGSLPSVLTDGEGKASIGGLAAGRWSVEVRHGGHMSYHAELALAADAKPSVLSASHLMAPGATSTMKVKFSRGRAGAPAPAAPAPRSAPPSAPPPPIAPAAPAPAPVPSPTTSKAQVKELPPVPTVPPAPAPVPAPATEKAPVKELPPVPTVAPAPAAVPAPAAAKAPAKELPPVATVAPAPAAVPAPATAKAPARELPPVPTVAPAPAAVPPPVTAKPAAKELPPAPPVARASAPAPSPVVQPPAAPAQPSPASPAPLPARTPPLATPPAVAPAVPSPAAPVASPAPAPPAPVPVAAAPPVASAQALPSAPLPARARLCVECPAGESAAWGEAAIEGGATAGCPADFSARLKSVELSAVGRLSAELASAGAGCRIIAVELPAGARFTGFRYEAQSAAVAADCLPGRACPAGDCRFPNEPVLRVEGNRTTLLVAFESTAAELRRAVVAGYSTYNKR